LVSTLINKEAFAETLVDSGCLSYGVIDSRFVRKHNLQRIKITPRKLVGVGKQVVGKIDEVVAVRVDVDGCIEERAFFYVAPELASYDLILGLAWMRKNQVLLSADRMSLTIGSQRVYVRN
jgi:predicted aspartyl protease